MTATTVKKAKAASHKGSPMTDAEIFASVEDDPDACPTPLGVKRDWQPYIYVAPIRRRLGLTQEEFGARYGIPVSCIRDWEQNRTRPDRATVSYLRAISQEPEILAEIVGRKPKRRDAE